MFFKRLFKRKPVVAVDVDDTLLDTLSPLLEYFNSTHDTRITREQCVNYRLQEIFGYSEEEGFAKIKYFFSLPEGKDLKPTPGAIEAIQALKKDFSLIALTARWKHMQKLTEKQLEKHFPGVFMKIVCCGDEMSKKDYCTKKRIHHIIDDAPHHAHECAENGVNSYLFGEYGWNKEYKKIPGLSRTLNWNEVCDLLLNKNIL